MTERNDRAYYRLLYPLSCRPTLRIGAAVFAVADPSEEGIRFTPLDAAAPAVDSRFCGQLHLPTGEAVDVERTILWSSPLYVGAQLTVGVPFSLMLDQQRYLQRRLVDWS